MLQQRAKAKPASDPKRNRLKQLAKTAENQATVIRDMIETLEGEEE